MCKLAVLDPERINTNHMANTAMELYRSQRSGLGVVAVIDEGDRLSYHVEKWLDPNINEVGTFIDEFHDEAAWFVLHGRLATSGDRASLEATHPIEVNCDECEIDYVLHNGVYARGPVEERAGGMEDDGHNFTTHVDTELMAHRIGKVPEEIAEADDLLDDARAGFEQGVVLLNEDRMMLYSNRKYTIDEHGEMYLSHATYANVDTDHEYSLMIIEPGVPEDDN